MTPFRPFDEVRHRSGARGRVLEVYRDGSDEGWRVLTEPTDGRTGTDWWLHCDSCVCEYKLDLVTS